MKMAAREACRGCARSNWSTPRLTWLWVQPAVCRLCDCSAADMTADPNDRLKLVNWAGGLDLVCVCVYDRRGAGLIRNNLLVCGQWCCRDHYKQWRATRVRMWSRLMSGMGGVPQIQLTGRPNWRLNQLRGCTHGNDGETKWNTSASDDCVQRSVWLVLLLSTCRLSRRTLCRKQTVQTEN